MTREVRMPISRAASSFAESARIALPNQVRFTTSSRSDHDHASGGDEDDRAGVLEDARVRAKARGEEELGEVLQEDRASDRGHERGHATERPRLADATEGR
jgi:hypothetical protein